MDCSLLHLDRCCGNMIALNATGEVHFCVLAPFLRKFEALGIRVSDFTSTSPRLILVRRLAGRTGKQSLNVSQTTSLDVLVLVLLFSES